MNQMIYPDLRSWSSSIMLNSVVYLVCSADHVWYEVSVTRGVKQSNAFRFRLQYFRKFMITLHTKRIKKFPSLI